MLPITCRLVGQSPLPFALWRLDYAVNQGLGCNMFFHHLPRASIPHFTFLIVHVHIGIRVDQRSSDNPFPLHFPLIDTGSRLRILGRIFTFSRCLVSWCLSLFKAQGGNQIRRRECALSLSLTIGAAGETGSREGEGEESGEAGSGIGEMRDLR